LHTEEWLSYNTIQTRSEYWRIPPVVLADYCRLPVVLAEGAYEYGPEYPRRPIPMLVVGEQVWWAVLGGSFQIYGQAPSLHRSQATMPSYFSQPLVPAEDFSR
jgi:hypothetical protein